MSSRSIRHWLAVSALLSASVASAADSVVVLMYHRFGEDRYPSTSIATEQFDAHLRFLESGGFTVVSLAAVLTALEGSASLPERAVAITIDDAYSSVYDVAFPRLAAFGYPFTVFVASDGVDEGSRALMTWDQMREMQDAGASYANHGAAHGSLALHMDAESDPDRRRRARADIERGRERLTAELTQVLDAFAYPYGEYDTLAAEIVTELKIPAFGQQSGAIGPLSDRRALPRFPMSEAFGTLDQFATKVASLPMPVVAIAPWDPVTTESEPRISITLGPSDARLSALACFVGGQGRVDVDWQAAGERFVVGPRSALGAGRHRVNCTAPRSDGRFFWFSHQWIVVNDN